MLKNISIGLGGSNGTMKIWSQTPQNVKLLDVSHRMSFSTDVWERKRYFWEEREEWDNLCWLKEICENRRKLKRKRNVIEESMFWRPFLFFFYCTRLHRAASWTNNGAKTGGGALTAVAPITELTQNPRLLLRSENWKCPFSPPSQILQFQTATLSFWKKSQWGLGSKASAQGHSPPPPGPGSGLPPGGHLRGPRFPESSSPAPGLNTHPLLHLPVPSPSSRQHPLPLHPPPRAAPAPVEGRRSVCTQTSGAGLGRGATSHGSLLFSPDAPQGPRIFFPLTSSSGTPPAALSPSPPVWSRFFL